MNKCYHIIGYNIGGYGTQFLQRMKNETNFDWGIPRIVFTFCPVCGKRLKDLKSFQKALKLKNKAIQKLGEQNNYSFEV